MLQQARRQTAVFTFRCTTFRVQFGCIKSHLLCSSLPQEKLLTRDLTFCRANTAKMPDINKEFEFIMAVLKTGSITVNYDAASTMLGWNKKKTMNKMSDFRRFFLSVFSSYRSLAFSGCCSFLQQGCLIFLLD